MTDYWGEQKDLLVFIQSPAAKEKSLSVRMCFILPSVCVKAKENQRSQIKVH